MFFGEDPDPTLSFTFTFLSLTVLGVLSYFSTLEESTVNACRPESRTLHIVGLSGCAACRGESAARAGQYDIIPVVTPESRSSSTCEEGRVSTVLQFNSCTVGGVHRQARGESCRLKQRSGHQAGKSIPRPLAVGSVTEREPAQRLQVQQLNCHGEEQQMQQTAQSTHHSGAEAHRTAHYQDPAQTLPTQSKHMQGVVQTKKDREEP